MNLVLQETQLSQDARNFALCANRIHLAHQLPDPPSPDAPFVCKCQWNKRRGNMCAPGTCDALKADRDLGDVSGDVLTISEDQIFDLIANPPPPAANLSDKANLPAWAPGCYRAVHSCFTPRRRRSDLRYRSIIGCDADTVPDFDVFVQELRGLKLRGAVHSTFTERNPDGSWRLRAYFFLNRPATPDEWDRQVKPWMLRRLPGQDKNAIDAVRLLYLPVRTEGYRYAVL